ncbi:hypothetical protein ACPOL_3795 [Acidisarcina polymorpha]|uniref:Uncharacterized protein n=1 Tax=Acidisarcina polymorpha TaxID=2211140 RepID=A0A2Z5G2N9_9BACT|nr:hypothetical protein ACPOL_3795 [Acidisarcina polymorpha]
MQRVFFDELPPGFDIFAQQGGEDGDGAVRKWWPCSLLARLGGVDHDGQNGSAQDSYPLES